MKKFILFLWMFPTLALGAPADSELVQVSDLIKVNVNKALAVLSNGKLVKDQKRSQVSEIVNSLFNFDLMAKLSLGKKNWGKFNDQERKDFTNLFIQQLQESYYEKIELFTDETIQFGEPEKANGKIQVPTIILSKDRRYNVIYKVYKKDGDWKVYDVEIEGISIVMSFGLQYDQFLASGSAQDLLKKMKDKVLGPPEAFKKKADEVPAKEKQS